MISLKLETRRILKECLKLLNDVPLECRDNHVIMIRKAILRKHDELANELHSEIKKID